MAPKSLTDRVAALEAKVGSKTIQGQFREQAELIDKLFAHRFEELDKKWDPRFVALQKDMVIVREGISILLKRRPQ